jgi:hypothetical protein
VSRGGRCAALLQWEHRFGRHDDGGAGGSVARDGSAGGGGGGGGFTGGGGGGGADEDLPAGGGGGSDYCAGSLDAGVRLSDCGVAGQNTQPGGSVTVSYTAADTTPPQTTITSGPSGPFTPGPLDLRPLSGPVTNDATPTFAFASSEEGSSFECRVDDQAFTACDSPTTTARLADGPHTFEVRAIDQAGNVDPTPASSAFTVAPRCAVAIVIGPIALCLGEARAA